MTEIPIYRLANLVNLQRQTQRRGYLTRHTSNQHQSEEQRSQHESLFGSIASYHPHFIMYILANFVRTVMAVVSEDS